MCLQTPAAQGAPEREGSDRPQAFPAGGVHLSLQIDRAHDGKQDSAVPKSNSASEVSPEQPNWTEQERPQLIRKLMLPSWCSDHRLSDPPGLPIHPRKAPQFMCSPWCIPTNPKLAGCARQAHSIQRPFAFFVIAAVVLPCGSLGPLLTPMTTATALALGAKSRKVTCLSGSTWVKLSRNGRVGVGSGAGARVAVRGGVGV
jgi:hypothetical protein